MISMYQSSKTTSGYSCGDLLAGIKELAVGGLDDIRLGDAGDAVLAGLARVIKGQARDALAALRGRDGEVDEQIVVDLHALRADRVAALGVLAVERPVDALASGTLTGRTLANRSSALRMATFADSTFGHGSPLRGVVVVVP